MQNTATHEFDAVVIGAGPAGSSTAISLAQKGYSVALIERESFPRYRVGESLIPHCWFSLERLGVLGKMETADFAQEKTSVQFASTDGEHVHHFPFSEHTDHPSGRTWQVRRADFDKMLADHAAELGAKTFFETNARGLIREDGRITGVKAETKSGEELIFSAKVVLDASGRNLFSVSKTDWREPDKVLKKMACWTYYKGAKRDGVDGTATTVAYLPEKGWFWYIPLPDDVVSVGVVADRDYLYRGERDPKAIFDREVEIQQWIKDHVEDAEQVGEYRVTGDYSYRSRYSAEDGLVLVGDAFAFLDPVFSSGVFLALRSGVLAADAVDAAIKSGDLSAGHFQTYADQICHEIEAMRGLVYAFYDKTFSFGDLVKARPDLREDLTECLIGNLSRDFTELFDAVGQMAELPERLSHGKPLVGQSV